MSGASNGHQRLLFDAAGGLIIAPAALVRFFGMRMYLPGKKAGEALDRAGFGLSRPVLRHGMEVVQWIAGDFPPTIALVLANGPINHGDRIQVHAFARREGVERPLQPGAARHELFDIRGLAALVIDDYAVVAEDVDAVDAALDFDSAGKVQ